MSKKQFQADSLTRAARPVIEALETRTLLSVSTLPAAVDSSLAYDATGKLHLVYQDGADKSLKYATRLANGRWADGGVIDDSSPDVGAMPSLALDSAGNPAVAYYDAWNGDLKYSHWNGKVWDTQTVDTHGATGLYPSLAFDSADAPIIASYSATRGDLRLSKLYHGGWRSFTLDAEGDVGRHPALAVDPTSGLWTVAYEATEKGELRFVNAYNGGRVLGGVIDAKALGGSVALAFEGDGSSRARVAYADAATGEVRLATGTAAGWKLEAVGAGTDAAAVRPGGGTAGVVYRDAAGTLRLAERPAVQKAAWSSVEIGAGAAGSAAAFSSAGDVAVTQPGANPAAASAPAVGERFAAAPSRVTVTHVDASTLRLDWLDNTVGEGGFNIESSADGGQTWQQATVAGRNATATNVGGLTEGKTYTFRASATGGSAKAATASANAAAAPASSGTTPLDTPGWFRINGIALASEAERTYNLTDHVGIDTSRAFYASSWADAAYQAAAAYINPDGTSAYEHVDNTNRDYFTTDSGAFRFGYSAAIKRETEGPATQLPDDETLKIIAFEDSHAAIDRDFDDRYWTVSATKLPEVEITVSDAEGSEVGPNTASYTITRTGSLEQSLTVTYRVGGTATPMDDYAALSGSVTILAGSSSAEVLIVPKGDLELEDTETVEVSLTADRYSPYVLKYPIAVQTSGGATRATGDPTTQSTTTKPATTRITDPQVAVDGPVELWWFNGEDALQYSESGLLQANKGQMQINIFDKGGNGEVQWKVVNGKDQVTLEDDDDATITGDEVSTGILDDTVTVKSTAGSLKKNDVVVQLIIDGRLVGDTSLTVKKPDSQMITGFTDMGPPNPNPNKLVGYLSLYTFKILDQFGDVLPKQVEVNEVFGVKTEIAPNNWLVPKADGATQSPDAAEDGYGELTSNPATSPQPVSDAKAVNAGDKIRTLIQTHFVGSETPGKGVPVAKFKITYYRGYARIELA